jgi:hypothetical protein
MRFTIALVQIASHSNDQARNLAKGVLGLLFTIAQKGEQAKRGSTG